ncbi:MAG: class I tRNA ligase family protein, partial [Clostridia bacterium]|nr:class I tRNA ligase family protein [Clostridia bacterium]
GMILGENGEKMSKSRGNVVNPDDIVKEYGADTMRLYEMFIGDFEKAAPWSSASIRGCRRFLERVWALCDNVSDQTGYTPSLEIAINKTIRKVGEDIEGLKYNTAIAALMALLNDYSALPAITRDDYRTLLILLNPFAPHMTEELWAECGFDGQISAATWPTYDEAKCEESTVEIVVQVNGKIKSRLVVPRNAGQADVLLLAKADDKVAAAIDGMTLVKELYVPGKLVNLVVRPA